MKIDKAFADGIAREEEEWVLAELIAYLGRAPGGSPTGIDTPDHPKRHQP